MRLSLRTATSVAVMALSITTMASPSLADGKPWMGDKPTNMTVEHDAQAEAARVVHLRMGKNNFGYNPLTARWSWKRGVVAKRPLGNISKTALTTLASGKYFLRESTYGLLQVSYLRPDHTAVTCAIKDGYSVEYPNDIWGISGTSFGLSGMYVIDRKFDANNPHSFAIVADPKTGLVGHFVDSKNSREVIRNMGWFQAEFPAFASVYCPNLPRDAAVNREQSRIGFEQMLKAAKPIRGFKVEFPNNPRDPLTGGMYYWKFDPTK